MGIINPFSVAAADFRRNPASKDGSMRPMYAMYVLSDPFNRQLPASSVQVGYPPAWLMGSQGKSRNLGVERWKLNVAVPWQAPASQWQMANGKWPISVCHLAFAIWHLAFAIWHLASAICHLPFAICHLRSRRHHTPAAAMFRERL
jgi:hypothetical protein